MDKNEVCCTDFLSWTVSLQHERLFWQHFPHSRTSFKIGTQSSQTLPLLYQLSLCNILNSFNNLHSTFTRSRFYLRNCSLSSSLRRNSLSVQVLCWAYAQSRTWLKRLSSSSSILSSGPACSTWSSQVWFLALRNLVLAAWEPRNWITIVLFVAFWGA